MNPSEPQWIAITGAFGLGAVVGNVVSFVLTSRWQRQVWLRDNRKAEWRELIESMNEGIEKMGYAFERGVARAASDPLRNWMGAMGAANRTLRSRIFIAEIIEKRGIVKSWDDLMHYVLASDNPRDPRTHGGIPTLNGYNSKAIALQDEIIRVS